MHINLWHRPYNGGWIWFDRTQWRRFAGGYGVREYDHAGNPHTDPTLWWCLLGFCGRITLQTMPWQKNPAKVLRDKFFKNPTQ